tara:strand:+ start:42 stop:395 length:354 start_codon:yes stop_codon:yes gene_type:complete
MSLKEYIKNMINYDNKVSEVNNNLKFLKKKKNELEQYIISILIKNNYSNSKFEIEEKLIYIKKKETQGTLSLELIRDVLNEEIKNPKSVDLLMEKIVDRKNSKKKISYNLEIKTKTK